MPQAITSVAAQMLLSFGFELTIFAVTLVLAVVSRKFLNPDRDKTWKQKSSKAKGEQSDRFKATVGTYSSNSGSQRPIRSSVEASPLRSETADKVASVIDCAKKRQWGKAIDIYEEMKATGKHLDIKDAIGIRKGEPLEMFGLLAQSAGSNARPELILSFLNDMTIAGIDRSLPLYESIMKLLASKKCYREALDVFSKLEADGFEPSLTTLGCLVSFAAELGEADQAISLFNRLASTGMPSIRAYMTILRVYSRRSDWPSSLTVLRDMQRREAPIDCLVLNVVLATGVSVGQLDGTSALLKEFSQARVADVVSYNTVIKGYARQKGADKAIQLLDEMCETGLQPNVITFNTVMDAAVRCFRVPDAWRMLLRMRGAGLTPDKFTCTTLMKGLQTDATSQQLSEILDLLRSVTAQCDSALASSLFRSVIEATAKINDPQLTARAVVQMREQKVMLSSSDYHRLLQLLMRDDGNTHCSTAQNQRLH